MSLKFGFFFIICLTSQINKILANHCGLRNTETVEVCLGNKNVEVQISPGDFTCEINKISRSKGRDDYTYTPGIAYHKFHTQAKTWNEARKVCFQEGGHLAVVDSKEEEKVLRSMFKKYYDNIVNATSLAKAYVGVYALFETGDWLTIQNEPLSSIGFDNWAAACDGMNQQPYNLPGYQCAAISRECEGMFNEKCDERRPFFCEIPDKCSRLGNDESAQAANRNLDVQISTRNFRYQDTTQKPRKKTEDVYIHTPGIGYHKFHTQAKTWNEARRVCFDEGGHLAIINSTEEEKVLQNIFEKNYDNVVNAEHNFIAHVGVHALFRVGEWLTVLNQPLSSIGFDNWAANCSGMGQQPNNIYMYPCAVIRKGCEGMFDDNCAARRPFFCEKPEMRSQLGNAKTAQAANKNHDVQISPSDFTCKAIKKPNPIVPADYTHTPGIGYHKFHPYAEPWNEARRICSHEGGHLAIINSREEMKVLRGMLEKNYDNIKFSWFNSIAYVGIHSRFEKGEWLTVLNEPISSSNFVGWETKCGISSQPYKLPHYQCGVIWKECGNMVSSNCETSLSYFCEIPEKCS